MRVSAPFCSLGAHCCPVPGSAQRGPGFGLPGAELSWRVTCWKPHRFSARGQAGSFSTHLGGCLLGWRAKPTWTLGSDG